VRLELFPASSADEWLRLKMDSDTPIHAAMAQFLRRGDVFIDVGANIGLFSILAAAKYEAEVYAFEPSERELMRLTRNAVLNNVSINTIPVALGSVAMKHSICLQEPGNHTMNRIASSNIAGVGASRCEIRRLDAVLQPEIFRRTRLVKIDVEGYEMNVLLGMTDALEYMRHAVLVVEITPSWLEQYGSRASDLYEFLTTRGWRPRGRIRDEMQWDEIFIPPLR
jgi:FkbM family methyltransferase